MTAIIPELAPTEKGNLSKAVNGQHQQAKPGYPKKLSAPHLVKAIRDKEVNELFLEGKTITEISMAKDLSLDVVNGAIRRFRNQLAEDTRASLAEHTEHSIAGLNRLLSRLWDEYDNSDQIRMRLPIMSEIRRVSESIARIRGLITNKSLIATIEVQKLHNFVDTFPAPIIDSVVRDNVPQTQTSK